ncbi:EF-hand calcium-binding domain-containing 5 [Brachionus plicatilis]|uniref:EF-hand calcium-binding domain-containing 5 n=1 Tax=Brachionus plicatilis TaxID=10195 RepID=A0A3M7QH05_BRAPC|nr:EF-hand calcium-binding domain-containing 5 [Brachionus plicatilis]
MTEILSNSLTESSIINEIETNNLYQKHFDARTTISLSKKEAENLNRKIPIELLALEWLTKLDSSSEIKTYLLENFLPILVLGCEKILKDAQSKRLLGKNETDPNFNPINRLAQFLMRNNPKSVNHHEKSPYVRTTREVYQHLRDQLYVLQGNKLATVKENVRKRRSEREKIEKLQKFEISKRKSQIEALFEKFNVPTNGRLEFSILIECLKFYKKFISNLATDEQKNLEIKSNFPPFCYNRDDLNVKKRLMKSEFIETLLFITEDMESKYFENFSDFIEQCSIYFVNLANMNNFRTILHNLLIMLDSTSTGYLSRRRIIKLLKDFREKDANLSVKDPLEWPILDPFIKFENKLEQLIPSAERKLSEISKDFLMSQISLNPISEKESAPKLADENQVESEKTVENNDQNDDQNVKEEIIEKEIDTEVSKETEKPQEDNTNATDNATDDDSKEAVKPSEENSKNIEIPLEGIENEPLDLAKMFMRGGIFYYTPITNTFQIDLLDEVEEEPNINLLNKFDPEFVNSKQFRNLINVYVSDNFLNSEIYVNNLIVYLKDNYAESRFEKNSKQNKNRTIKQEIYRNKKYSSCFEKLDNEGSGQLSLNRIELALQDFKDGLFKEQITNAINLTRSEISANGKSDDYINRNEFFDLISVLVGLVDFPKFEDQLLNYLSCLNGLDVNEKTRGEVRKKWLSQIKYVGDITCGSFEPLFKQLFFTLLKDAENHGMKNGISAYIGVLEHLENGSIGLKFLASTPHDSKNILGKSLTRDDKCVSFEVIDSTKSKHVENVRLNENVFHFNPSGKSDGSFVLIPLKYARNKVFGTIGIDTLQNTNQNSNFTDHELSFYQGLANSFAISYAHIIFKNRLIKTCFSSIEWLKSRCNGIDEINVYFVQIVENESNLSGSEENTTNQTDEKFSLNLKPIIKFNRRDDKLVNVLNDTGYMTEEILKKNNGK